MAHPRMGEMVLRRFLLTTLGSLGDLHPYLAIGRELRRRGHRVRMATLGLFRERVEAAGLQYAPLRAVVTEQPTPELIRRVLYSPTGVEYLLRKLVFPALRTAYEDTLAAAADADLLLAHPLTFATPAVAETLKRPWISTQLAPFGLLSAYDPPVLPGLGWLRRIGAGPRVFRAVLGLADWQTRRWLGPFNALRAELGLPQGGNPMFAGAPSPLGVLALFSPFLAEPQRDWPTGVTITGFPFFDEAVPADPALSAWLVTGPPPVIFTLGSSAVMAPGKFFQASVEAARRMGVRALLLGYSAEGSANLARELGQQPRGGPLDGDKEVFAAPYASYAEVFPQAAAVVHQGGIGTTAEALRAGRPMLVVPFGVDQPDNAARVRRLGVAEVLGRREYRAAKVGEVLHTLLNDARMVQRATDVGALVRAEKGVCAACDALEAVVD